MFYLKAFPTAGGAPVSTTAEISLGDHVESFPLITTHWSVDEYEEQWHRAVEALVAGKVQRCMLISDIQPPDDSASLSYWALFRTGMGVVAVQNRFMRTVPTAVRLQVPEDVEPLIPPRVQGTPEEHALVSEWLVAEQDLLDFLRAP